MPPLDSECVTPSDSQCHPKSSAHHLFQKLIMQIHSTTGRIKEPAAAMRNMEMTWGFLQRIMIIAFFKYVFVFWEAVIFSCVQFAEFDSSFLRFGISLWWDGTSLTRKMNIKLYLSVVSTFRDQWLPIYFWRLCHWYNEYHSCWRYISFYHRWKIIVRLFYLGG